MKIKSKTKRKPTIFPKREHLWKRIKIGNKVLRKCEYCGILGFKKNWFSFVVPCDHKHDIKYCQ